MKWFKHYSSLHEKEFSQRLIQKHGLEAYARYIILLETCAQTHGDRADGKYVLSKSLLSGKLVAKRQSLRSHLLAISQEMDIKVVENLYDFTIEIPILSELLHKDALSWKRRRATGGPTSPPQAGQPPRLEEEEEEELKIYKKTKSPKADFAESVFDAFYKKYPRKENKTRGKRIFTAQIKNSESFEKINFALDRFLKHHENLKTEKKYIPHFGTWMGQWSDWLDPSTGLCEDFSAGKKEFNGVVPD